MIAFRLNGAPRTFAGPPDTRLSAILETLGDPLAARVACAIGRCGVCLALVNDRAVNGCLVMAWQLDGAEIVTSEGLDTIQEARVVKAALTAENSFQCGYCAPGFVIALTDLARRDPMADEAAIRHALSGNICRCTGYHSILRGAARAFRDLAANQSGDAA